MKRIFLVLCLMVALPARAETQAEAVGRIERYLSGITTLSADFTQASPDGSVAEGIFYLQRPGKMRWEYKPPMPVLIISSGKQLVYFDKELEQVSYLPIDDSLIGFLAKEPIRLNGGVKVTDFSEENNTIQVTLVQADKPDNGQLTLRFSDAPLELRHLTVKDATGQITEVSLANARFGQKLDKELFIFRDPRGKRK